MERKQAPPIATNGALESAVLKALKSGNFAVDALSVAVDRSIPSVQATLESLRSKGHNIDVRGSELNLSAEVRPGSAEPLIVHNLAAYNNQWKKFGACGDNHLGSKHERLDVLNALYDVYEQEGVTEVFNTGNWIEGNSRLNYHDVKIVGLDDQVDYFIEKYPQRKGITTYYVAGDDHEGWFQRQERIEIGKYAEYKARGAGRNDLIYLGYVEADVELKAKHGSSWMKVMHPGGGSAYALSYAAQKLVESLQGGEKPQVLLYGHYHKFDYNYAREVHCVGTGCFSAYARIDTKRGQIPIANVRVGDSVKTHRNRWMPVTTTMTRMYDGDWYRISTGRSAVVPSKGQVTATAEHPFLTPDGWVPISQLKRGDWVAVASKDVSGERIPWYRSSPDSKRFKGAPNNKHGRHGKVRGTDRHNAALDDYINANITLGRILKTDNVIPDAIHIDWEAKRVTAIEMERDRRCPGNPRKYDLVPGMYDDVLWLCTKRAGRASREYRVIDGIVYVQVKNIEKIKYSKPRRVFNFSVAGDESYIACNHIVHNCTVDQSIFMRKSKIQAHVGGCMVWLNQAPDGTINRFRVEWMPFYDRGFYAPKKRNFGLRAA